MRVTCFGSMTFRVGSTTPAASASGTSSPEQGALLLRRPRIGAPGAVDGAAERLHDLEAIDRLGGAWHGAVHDGLVLPDVECV